MNWNEFYKAIDSGSFAPVYLFIGPEEYIKRDALEALRRKLLPPGLEALNDTVMEGASARQIIDAAETLPVMSEKRLVVVRDWAPLLPGKSKDESEETERMQVWLADPPQSCALVFYMRTEPDGRKKMSSILKKAAVTVNFPLLNDPDLAKWCASRLKPLGKRISSGALSTLTFMAGRELTRLSGELDKLAAYMGDARAEIREDDVLAIVPASPEYNGFELLNRLLNGDMKNGQQMINSLLQNGQNPLGILAMLTRQIRQLAHIKSGLEAGKPLTALQEQLQLHPYAAKKSAQQCAGLSSKWLVELFEKCVESDYTVKSGRLRDRDALDSLVQAIALKETSVKKR
ncbi:MAG: DNA polymerase III subunit delta [Clostridia bacterium]|nr:DNA polymerase III subunit delta [Clostridia bacterium]